MSEPNEDRGRPIEVEWYDSERVNLGWESAEDYIAALEDRQLYRTAGYYLGETDKGLMIALSQSAAGNFCEAMVIPMPVVVSRRWLS